MKKESDTGGSADQGGDDPKGAPTAPPAALKKDGNEARRMWRQVGQFGHIGIEFGVATGIGYVAGRWLDGKLDTAPGFAVFLALCGTAAAGLDLYYLVRRIQRENES